MKLKIRNLDSLTAFSSTAFLLIILLAVPGCKKTETGTITVSVVDLRGTPARGVSVTLAFQPTARNIKKTTSPKGTCMFTAVPAGNNYVLKIEKTGYITQSREKVKVANGKETFIRLLLPVDRKQIPGNWRVARADAKTGSLKLSAKQKEAMRKLETSSYLSGYKAAPGTKNVTIYDKKKAYNGLNLYCSGHAPEAILIDMKGKELHRWHYDITGIREKKYNSPLCLYWRRVHLMENGDLLAIFEGHLLIKIDKNSHLLWSYSGGAHHDLFIMPDGSIYVLTRNIYWEYRGTPEPPFYTGDCGSCQRLPNGNTLISETASGRAFEVTPGKTIVWEFYNPQRAGDNNELIASLFEMIRLSPDYTSNWLQ